MVTRKAIIAGLIIAAGGLVYSVQAQQPPVGSPIGSFDFIDGVACAHLSQQIETLEKANSDRLNEVSEIQATRNPRDRSGQQSEKAALAAYNALVDYRRSQIENYEIQCSGAKLKLSELKRICDPRAKRFDFSETKFCQPYRQQFAQ